MILRLNGTAGFILAVFLIGCGEPRYRLEGTASGPSVAIFDSTAKASVDSIHTEFDHMWAMVTTGEAAAIDSMAKHAAALGPTIRRAEKQLREARNHYRTAFKKMHRFRSFGGNPVFSDDDVSVSTKKLLNEIAERFYKGRAFSLETEGQIRAFIRKELVPKELAVQKARNRLSRLKKSQRGRSDAKSEITATTETKRRLLIDDTNKQIGSVLRARVVRVDSAISFDQYAFEGISPGRYFVGSGVLDSIQKITEVTVTSHVRLDVNDNIGQSVLVVDPRTVSK